MQVPNMSEGSVCCEVGHPDNRDPAFWLSVGEGSVLLFCGKGEGGVRFCCFGSGGPLIRVSVCFGCEESKTLAERHCHLGSRITYPRCKVQDRNSS